MLYWWTIPGTIPYERTGKLLPWAKNRIVQISLISRRFSLNTIWLKLIVTELWEAHCVVTEVTRGAEPHDWSCVVCPALATVSTSSWLFVVSSSLGSQQSWPKGQQRCSVCRLAWLLPGWFNRHWHLTMEKHNTQLPVGHIKTWSKHKLSPTPGNCE